MLINYETVCLLVEPKDLPDASPTVNPPCSSRLLCPSTHIQDLGGCDAATGKCICERGYDLDPEGGVCMGQLTKIRFHSIQFNSIHVYIAPSQGELVCAIRFNSACLASSLLSVNRSLARPQDLTGQVYSV